LIFLTFVLVLSSLTIPGARRAEELSDRIEIGIAASPLTSTDSKRQSAPLQSTEYLVDRRPTRPAPARQLADRNTFNDRKERED
jgi:hypothetical protein